MGFRHCIEARNLEGVLEVICKASPLEAGSVIDFIKKYSPTQIERKKLISGSLVKRLVEEARVDALKELWYTNPVSLGEILYRLLDPSNISLLTDKHELMLQWFQSIGISVFLSKTQWQVFLLNGHIGLAKMFYQESFCDDFYFLQLIFEKLCSKRDIEYDTWKATILWMTTIEERFVAYFTGDATHCTLHYYIRPKPFITTRQKVEVRQVITCSVCDEKKSDVITKCKHQFCKDCISSWYYRHNRTCPMCRANLDDEVYPIVPPPKKKRAPRKKATVEDSQTTT